MLLLARLHRAGELTVVWMPDKAQEYIDSVLLLDKRIKAIDEHIQRAASKCVFWSIIESLMALRCIYLLATTCVVADLGDLTRFATAPQLMA
jgi:transposase